VAESEIKVRLDGFDDQPVSHIEWVHRDELHANDYNPNHVPPPELRLLKLSIIEDHWTQPIVIREDENGTLEIVDGYHRWLVSDDKKIREMTDGYVPVVRLKNLSPAQQRMATIRHNRARGEHHVMKMADIVDDLVNRYGVDSAEVERRLQMEEEEVKRFLDHGNMVKRGSRDEFGKAWTIKQAEADE
jgi:ParB-like chromosome segregation protein Spo0J